MGTRHGPMGRRNHVRRLDGNDRRRPALRRLDHRRVRAVGGAEGVHRRPRRHVPLPRLRPARPPHRRRPRGALRPRRSGCRRRDRHRKPPLPVQTAPRSENAEVVGRAPTSRRHRVLDLAVDGAGRRQRAVGTARRETPHQLHRPADAQTAHPGRTQREKAADHGSRTRHRRRSAGETTWERRRRTHQRRSPSPPSGSRANFRRGGERAGYITGSAETFNAEAAANAFSRATSTVSAVDTATPMRRRSWASGLPKMRTSVSGTASASASPE